MLGVVLRKLLQWIVAFIIAILLMNTFMLFYYRPAGWIPRTNSATNAIWNPGARLYASLEGRGVYKVDKNGYLNPDKELEGGGYTLIVGASHTAGLEVLSGQRFSDILNDKLMTSGDRLAVYNCSQNGYYFPDIINGFYAITQEFASAKNIVLEIGTTDFSEEELLNSLNQRGFDQAQLGCNILRTLSTKKKLIIKVKEAFPILSILNTQCKALEKKIRSEATERTQNLSSYKNALDKTLSLIRSEFDGRIIIVYHPDVSIEKDGTMRILKNDTDAAFAELCGKNGILFIDMSDAFLEAYRLDYSVPYGFSNTAMGTGHLNQQGHRMIAEALYEVLKGGDAE